MSSKFQKVIILYSPIFLWRFWFLYITFPLIYTCVVGTPKPTVSLNLSEKLRCTRILEICTRNRPWFANFIVLSNTATVFLDHVQCIFDLIFMIDAHIFRAIFRVNVNCWYLLERVQFDSLSYCHLWLFASKWPYIMWTRIT